MRGNIFASGFAGGGMAYIHCLKLLCLALVLFASVADAAMPKKNGAYITATAHRNTKPPITIPQLWLVRLLPVTQINTAALVVLL